MHALIINIESNTERRAQILEEVKKLDDITYEVTPAITHDNGSIGCTLSHLKCIEYAKQNDWEYVLILEDDTVFMGNVNEVFKKTFQEVCEYEWNLLYLGGLIRSKSEKISDNLVHVIKSNTTHAYVIHKRFYDIALSIDTNIAIDLSYRSLSYKHKMYMCNPMVAFQRPGWSSIQRAFVDYKPEMLKSFDKFVNRI
jgi:glycosyl transferase family 25